MQYKQDVFISHASADKPLYIQPLADALSRRHIGYWLDSEEIGWGDNLVMRLNEGLRESRFGLLCLSENYLKRPWPEHEFSAFLAMQNSSAEMRVLPLILDSESAVLAQYPLIAGLAYRTLEVGVEKIADDLAARVGRKELPAAHIVVVIESKHTGHVCRLTVPESCSVQYLLAKARAGIGLKTTLDTGSFERFPIRWVLVEAQAWGRIEELARLVQLPQRRWNRIVAAFMRDGSLQLIRDPTTRLCDVSLPPDPVFYMLAAPDIDQDRFVVHFE